MSIELHPWLMEVAVVRSVGANHTAEMAGGAAMTVTPQMPFRMEQTWLVTRKYVWLRLTERRTVPTAIRRATSMVVSRRPLRESWRYEMNILSVLRLI